MTDIKNLRKRSIANIYSQLEQRYKILIVDNQYEFRDYLECDLSKWLQIITDNCGHGGIQKAKNEMPDLIIYELRIPDIDGFEFVKIIKEELETSHIPIILLTTKISDGSIIRCISLGVNAIIIKPFEIDYLLLYIINLLLNNQRLKQKFIRDIVLNQMS
jgi:CheY-like chemotaxis protein